MFKPQHSHLIPSTLLGIFALATGSVTSTMTPPKKLFFITGNRNKLIEVEALLGDTVALKSQDLDLVEIQGTIEEISTDKCKRAAEIVCSPPPYLHGHF
jgi:inosine triphosphate pyrophosphatase